MKKMTKEKEIQEMAELYNMENDFLFRTTFNRYKIQLKIMSELEEKINNEGVLTTKSYVKDVANTYSHPAVAEYNKTATSANQTVNTLIKIIKSLGEKNKDSEDDELDFILK